MKEGGGHDKEVASSKLKTSLQKSIPYLWPKWRQNGQNWYPIYDQNGWKTLPFGAAHTYIAHIREYLPRGRHLTRGLTRQGCTTRNIGKNICWSVLVIRKNICWLGLVISHVSFPRVSTCACDLRTAETAIPMIIRGRDNSHHLLAKPKTPCTASRAASLSFVLFQKHCISQSL